MTYEPTMYVPSDIEKRLEIFKNYLDRNNMTHNAYQYEGVRWILKNELNFSSGFKINGGFIADEMGLGKTILMIGTMLCNFKPKTLIVVPPILVQQWYDQIKRTTGHCAVIYNSNHKPCVTAIDAAIIVITTYGQIALTKNKRDAIVSGKKKPNILTTIKWNRIIFDEAHHLRNVNTSKHQGCKLLKADIRWLVSGTPIQNRKDDFYNLCNILRIPAEFYTNVELVLKYARSFILKRTKKQIGIKMCDLNTSVSEVKWDNPQEYMASKCVHSSLSFIRMRLNDEEKENNIAIVNNLDKLFPIHRLLLARQMCVLPRLALKHMDNYTLDNFPKYETYDSKLRFVVNKINENRGNSNGKLVFCQFHAEIDELRNQLKECGFNKIGVVDGRATSAEKKMYLTLPYEVLLMQIQSCCEGLNMQEHYSEIYFVAPHWNPAVEEQAIARCYRIGQKKPVSVYRFIMNKFDPVPISTLTHEDDADLHSVIKKPGNKKFVLEKNDITVDPNIKIDDETDIDNVITYKPINIETYVKNMQELKMQIANETFQ
jgi:SNF2 family DNA or RNA helicase